MRAADRPDARALATDLQRAVRGEVRFDDGSRALYATDASNYRQVPIGVVVPCDVEDVVHAVEVCRVHDAPVLPRGGGTSLAGQCCNVAVVLDLSKHLHRVLEIDPDRKTARVEPGLVLDALQRAAKPHGLVFGPDPATHAHCTLGGMIGNNACGIHSVMAGRTADNVEELDVLTYEGDRMRVGRTPDAELERIVAGGGRRGEVYARLRGLRDRYAAEIRARFPDIPRRVSGYNLDELLPEKGFNVARALVGTEGTCLTVLGATVRLVDDLPARALLVLGYPDVFAAADDAPEVVAAGAIGLEGIDDVVVERSRKKRVHPEGLALLPEGRGWLLAEFGGADRGEAEEKARRLVTRLRRGRAAAATRLLGDPAQARAVWEVRASALAAAARMPGEPDAWEGWEDSAVPPERLGGYLRELRRLLDAYGYRGALYGHFGDGCLHTRITFDLVTAGGIRTFRAFLEEAAGLALSYGGSLSGEHGDGQSRAELLPKMFGPQVVEAFREFKAIWDPRGGMNPGKVVDPRLIVDDLRLGAAYRPARPATHFRFPDDDGSLARAALRCVGVGKCRREEGGIMCPSYMVTREEMHSTRGRARLLFEMLQGEVVAGRWRDEHVKEALDLCLACKGCKNECPVNVDMATYKAEFLAHYYRGRARPAAAYSMGLIWRWSRLAARAPALANRLARSPALKRLAGVAPEREVPAFAAPFTRRFRPGGRREGRRPVVLWPDTFTNHFQPQVLRAAAEVLEAAGFEVRIPPRPLCCGRSLYDFGMLRLAKRQLRRIVRTLGREIAAGVPVVGLEPSCVAVFRDELVNLFPDDEGARRLSAQTFTLAELLARERYEPPTLRRKAIVQRHCHHVAVMGFDADEALMRAMGLDVEVLDAGCCGMAGAFGFEADKYEVSMRVGERVLLPAVRRAAPETLILADGFSCREQIRQATGRRPLHLAEVLQIALREGREFT